MREAPTCFRPGLFDSKAHPENSEPQNFQGEAQNFQGEPQNFQGEAQNFQDEAQNFQNDHQVSCLARAHIYAHIYS